jgi:hypothetical protein
MGFEVAVSRPEKKERMVLTDLMETPRRRTEPTEELGRGVEEKEEGSVGAP